MDFRAAWDQVAALAGETFRTDRDQEFSYVFKKTFVVVSPGDQSIPRTNFEKVFKRLGSTDPAPAVQGERYIAAVYADSRFATERS